MSADFRAPPKLNHKETDNHIMNSHLSNISKDITSYYLVAKLKDEEYKLLFSLATKIANSCGVMPVEDIHCTLHSLKGNVDLFALCNTVKNYCSTLSQFHLKFTSIARTENSLGDRIWLMIDKTPQLHKMHRDVRDLAQSLSLSSYRTEDWKPHMKLLILPKEIHYIPNSDLFHQILDKSHQITTLELTQRTGEAKWETIAQFELKQ